ncbi:MAG: serine/threonine-protein kinase [Planctomycetota bacterium]
MADVQTNDDVIRRVAPSLGSQPAREDRLAQILDDYLISLEKGLPLDLEQLAIENADLATDIRSFASSLQLLHQTTAQMRPDSQPSPSQPSASKQLGDFRVGREIGRGGMGVVYEAQQLSLQRKVALKVLPFAAMWDQKQIARFRNEALAAAQLHHPNIVPVFAVGEERGIHFYAMQLIEGQSLDQIVRQLLPSKPQSLQSTVAAHSTIAEEPCVSDLSTQLSQDRSGYCRAIARLGEQAAEALHHAHEYGVVHRDIKPSNLMVDGEAKLWITDFGLARIQSSPGVTITGDVVGTLRYMSPEQAAGQHTLVDTRTDIYGLGATLYELLTLQPAFPGEDRQTVLRNIAESEPTTPRAINPAIPVDLETIVLQAMAKSRESRYATSQALADDLRRFLAGKPTLARRPTVVDRASKWMRRHRNMVALAAGFLLVLTLGSTIATVRIAQEQRRTAAALVDAKKNLRRANQHFAQARRVVDQFGVRLADQLQQTPGTEQLRQRLLVETLQYYRQFARQIEGQPDIQDQLAMTHLKTGVVTAKLGARRKAMAEYQAAQKLLLQLLEHDGENTHLRSQLALSRNNMALLFVAVGDTESALREYELAIAAQQQLVADGPQRMRFSSQLADSYLNLGTLLGERGEVARASKLFHTAIAILLANHERAPNEIGHGRSLAMAYNNLAYLNRVTDSVVAKHSAQQAVELLERICRTPAATDECLADLSLCYGNLAAIESGTQQTTAAIGSYQRAIQLHESLVRTAPGIVRYRSELAAYLNNLALLQLRAGEGAAASEAFQRANHLFAQLLDDYPGQIAYANGWAALLNNQGLALASVSRLDDALEAYGQAVVAQEQVWRALPNSSSVRRSLSRIYYNFGQALHQSGRSTEAFDIALMRRGLWQGDGKRLFSIAVELAALAKGIRSDQRGERDTEVIATVATALQAGYEPDVEWSADERFRDWHNHPDFENLLRQRSGKLITVKSRQVMSIP